ncbi:hypothetical protein NPIL_215891 [Nephila pilipes]|uniref:Uncharacterized protein n=1 Tax=Nephila pilipes TaxID=299642 RepID=A0A8X6NEQ0_NEPPI|nr:hypothetical protein NPIL_215891 [Nephila pilipes]
MNANRKSETAVGCEKTEAASSAHRNVGWKISSFLLSVASRQISVWNAGVSEMYLELAQLTLILPRKCRRLSPNRKKFDFHPTKKARNSN